VNNSWFNKWLKIHSGVDLQLKLSVIADLKFSASNEGERVDDKKARVGEHRLPVLNSLARPKPSTGRKQETGILQARNLGTYTT